jgi:hypothetical protein
MTYPRYVLLQIFFSTTSFAKFLPKLFNTLFAQHSSASKSSGVIQIVSEKSSGISKLVLEWPLGLAATRDLDTL